jgi:cell division protease FtsH
MSNRIGPVVVRRHEGFGAHTRDVADHPVSDLTSGEIDREVRRLVDGALSTARTVLERRRHIVDAIAQTLMREETLQGERLRRLLDGDDTEPARIDADTPTVRPPTIERPTNAHRPEAAA